ncbi:MAG TPA: LutB/LldF family L-lactate oxidation iron-sulfur protein [Blastocatellia bacterium]|nr:LutB/LldF family L-lactate oxidation iron-sulfur protein [Blastocatellia bacterium]
MRITTETFDENARGALLNRPLQAALRHATHKFVDNRRYAITELDDWEDRRQRSNAIKRETIEHLDRYLEEFTTNVEKAGGVVHWAIDSAEACRIVVDLIQSKGEKLVVKSKSMATEEINLNHALEAAGITPVETDLGEWIIQLAHETPSHIIAPAIHKSRADVARLFTDVLGIEYTDDIPKLTAVARERLRERFATAGVGVSGVNFGVAETGTICIVENEGNARMSTSLPRIHIAVMGIEKVIPKFTDLALFLSLLPRSATGQKLSSYTSFLTGTKRTAEAEGPDEYHLVMLDNGRTKILADPIQRSSLFCIRCGACLNACPVYQRVGGHAYGWVYSGPIGALLTPQFIGMDRGKQLPYASSLCGACKDVCPVKINIPELLLDLRSKIGGESGSLNGKRPRLAEQLSKKAFAFIMARPGAYNLAAKLGRILQLTIAKNGKIADVPIAPLSNWTKNRDFPTLAPQSFRERWKREQENSGKE